MMDTPNMAVLDDIFLREMHLLQDCLQIRAKLSQALEHGYHNLAKARYNMGNHRVSTAQVPAEMDASATVASRLASDSDYYELHLNVQEKKTPAADNGESKDGVHSRKLPDSEMEPGDASEEKKAEQSKDPLRWFGVLVPQELKTAQSSFKLALELSIQVANLQSQLQHTSQQFWTLVQSAPLVSKDEP